MPTRVIDQRAVGGGLIYTFHFTGGRIGRIDLHLAEHELDINTSE